MQSTRKAQVQALITSTLTIDRAKSILFYYVLLTQLLKAGRHLRARGFVTTAQEFWAWVSQRVIFLALRLPAAQRKVKTEMDKAKLGIEDKLVPKGDGVTRHLALPAVGQSPEWILSEMDKMDLELGTDAHWRTGKLSGAVYHGGEDLEQVLVAAFQRYCVSNPLHPDVFPAVRKMEAEIVAMCLRMYSHSNGAGTMTSGGTESIIVAVKTYRDWARATKGITSPEMVIPVTAHAAFDKGAKYLGVKVHEIPVDPVTRKVVIKRVKRAINANTIVGSCINFPDGNQDDIVELSALAQRYNIGLHVDCCLGSFIVPFLEAAGLAEGDPDGMFKLDPFDFRLPGVTSISCDTHKYGFAPKGTSVIMYRNAELRSYQYYVNPHWTGGVYASPSIAGSRPGSLIAGAWAAMHYIGSEGYLEHCRTIVNCTRQIARAIQKEIPELYVLGSPPASVVAFASRTPELNVLEVGDRMSARGWHLNALSRPAAVHIACTKLTIPLTDNFIADLKDSVREARAMPIGTGTMVSLYGLGNSSAVGPSMVGQLARAFIDTLYKA